MRLFFNGVLMPLEEPNRLAQTKQVNDLFSLSTRQTNFTNNFKIPATALVKKTFKDLGIVGNISSIPYELNRVDLFSDNGECYIFNGRATVKQYNGTHYEIQILDGNIDLFKKTENQKISDMPLDEINHTKNVPAIINSWTSSLPYKYIVADYNGMAVLANNSLNSDYLVPSVEVPYIWNKIHAFNGFTFEGSVFQTQEFINQWITYSKGFSESDNIQEILISDDWRFPQEASPAYQNWSINFNSASVNALQSSDSNMYFKVSESGTYKMDLDMTINQFQNRNYSLVVHKNRLAGTSATGFPVFLNWSSEGYINSGQQVIRTATFELNAGDVITVTLQPGSSGLPLRFDVGSTADFKLVKLTDSQIDFSDSFLEFSTKDFLKEFINRFCLVPIKDKYRNHYIYYTLSEIINAKPVDWSRKFVKKNTESYLYGAYAQRNYMRFKYNDKEGDYNDAYIDVLNSNLPEKTDIIQSTLYSPEKTKSELLGSPSNVYKMWDKEIKDDNTIKYKALDKRFYVMSFVNVTSPHQEKLESGISGQNQHFTTYPRESFSNVDFYGIISRNYREIGSLLNRALVTNNEMTFKDLDVSDFDFSKPVYIKQEGGVFIVNKIINYIQGKSCNVELIKLDLFNKEIIPVVNFISKVEVIKLPQNIFSVKVTYDASKFLTPNVYVWLDGVTGVGNQSQTSPNNGTVLFAIASDLTRNLTIKITEASVSPTRVESETETVLLIV